MNKELLKGTTELIILKMLQREPMYGYGIIKNLSLLSKGVFNFKEGTLYPILHHLEKEGLIEAFWQKTEGRRRKYYQLTQNGHLMLTSKTQEWSNFQAAVNDLVLE